MNWKVQIVVVLLISFSLPGCGGGTIGTGTRPPGDRLFRDTIPGLPRLGVGTSDTEDRSPELSETECDRSGNRRKCR